ncbi:ArsR type transcriptional regulator (plasmid) [Alkalihalophilus pseudofirmus OF4]|uniref:ArsR type transcriptional regulator n=1 Tax=Alkalihalophilus pseudofirmus (strain ATCC BAA-2126 / JCM 17055 / OF4) TaxID=398511 RepID=D3G110_ALKPO|nr:hypothetical protein [Alkalihalophilus pseudofirmus]ADC52036.1 ArsR type transcriptional regulator [Alkalihalophilus pseudofirmus OF4]
MNKLKKAKATKLMLIVTFLLLSMLLAACTQAEEEHAGHGNDQDIDHGEEMDRMDEEMDHGGHHNDSVDVDRSNLEQEAAKAPENLNDLATDELKVVNTKNITRINENDPIQLSIHVSQTVWPATHEENQPGTVILAPLNQWQYSLAALTLVHHPNDGPLLYWDGEISDDVLNELNRLQPKGNSEHIQVLVVGDLPEAEFNKLNAYNVEQVQGENAADFARNIEAKFTETINEVHPNVIIGSSEEDAKEYTISVGNWIAHMNESLLYVDNDGIPQETIDALNARENGVTIYLVGPEDIISDEIAQELETYGTVHRIEGDNPVAQSIEFASYKDAETGFGWGITSPGHGFVFSSTNTPELAIAAAPFAHLGKHAPMIWLDEGEITDELYQYLAKVKPAFQEEPTEGPYNHGFIIGTFTDIPFTTQGILDEKLEIVSLGGDDHGGH